jgi:hypothetical protein
MGKPDLQSLGMRAINHLDSVGKTREIQPSAAPNLTIVLRATQQLQQNGAATAAFTRAAKNWEDIIKSPVTVYLDVDYGATNFGQTWPSGVLGSTHPVSQSYPYQSVRTNLIAEANGEGNATKQAILNALPGTTVPTDLGDANSTDVTDPASARIGLCRRRRSLPMTRHIAFNSNFRLILIRVTESPPDKSILMRSRPMRLVTPGIQFEAGTNVAKPSVWDLYRFRTGTTAGTFTTAQES